MQISTSLMLCLPKGDEVKKWENDLLSGYYYEVNAVKAKVSIYF